MRTPGPTSDSHNHNVGPGPLWPRAPMHLPPLPPPVAGPDNDSDKLSWGQED
ncbi:hypothetical protein J6590_070364 [Homalodisca vitripennis]|nr:hypothetical protein J6590_070364 [Homalodisca vitripennis]